MQNKSGLHAEQICFAGGADESVCGFRHTWSEPEVVKGRKRKSMFLPG